MNNFMIISVINNKTQNPIETNKKKPQEPVNFPEI